MKLDDRLYERYLEELQELETFKLSHAERFSGVLKQVMEDPHTKHLVEVLAFFAARNHLQAENSVINLYRRLFRQYFPFLWSPLPSMGVTQFSPSKELSEIVEMRKGSEVELEAEDGRRGYFQTLEKVRILPIQVTKAQFEYSQEHGARFFLRFTSPSSLDEPVGRFSLYLNHLNHFPSSYAFSLALRQHLKGVDVSYDGSSEALDCQFDFDRISDSDLLSHPIEKLRSKLHFPEQELFLDIHVPPHQQRWRTFTLCFHLGGFWPKSFPFSKESLLPFVVPIINLQGKEAELIRCDGTKDSYPILYPDAGRDFALHSITGVYAIENHKSVPLRPGILSNEHESFEIESDFNAEREVEHRLLIDSTEAFQKTKLVTVDALWYQPWFDTLEHNVRAIVLNQVMRHIDVRVVGKISSPEDHAHSFDIPLLTRLLALKNQTRLELDDLLFLMNALKRHKTSYFKELPDLISEVKVNENHRSLSFSLSLEYHIFLEKLDDKNRALALLYFRYMKQFLDLWLPNFEVAVTVNASNYSEPITLREGTSHETSTVVRNLLLF